MVNKIINEGTMDKALEALGKSFSESEKWEINKPAVDLFYKALKKNINPRSVPYAASARSPRFRFGYNPINSNKKNETYIAKREDLIDERVLDVNKVRGGEVEVGFTKKGHRAYIARFMNDGWDPRNKAGGPYEHVEGEHFWERTDAEMSESVKVAELKAIQKVMHKRGLP